MKARLLIVACAVSLLAPGARAQDGLGKGHGAESRNMRLVAADELQGRAAFQPVIIRQGNRWIAYVGHSGGSALNPLTGKTEPNGTSIVDVTDPARPKYLHHLPTESDAEVVGAEGGGAQMLQLCAGKDLPKGDPAKFYMLRTDGSKAHEIWDITAPERPVRVSVVVSNLRSTHRQAWECDTGIAYVNSGLPDWQVLRLTQVWDLSDPAKPAHIRDFALPGQEPTAPKRENRRLYDGHGAFTLGPKVNRLYFGYGYVGNGAFQIVDRQKLIEGPKEPTPENLRYPQVSFQTVGTWQAVHSVYPLLGMQVAEFANSPKGQVRDFLLVLPEGIANECHEERQMMFVVDITDDRNPFGVANFQVPHASGNYCTRGGRFGPHQTQENLTPIYHKRIVFVAWFNAGVRAVDIRDPYHPKEIGYYVPATNRHTAPSCVKTAAGPRCKIAITTNNVEVDDRGYIYIADRVKTGLHILELTGDARKVANFK